MLFYYAIYLIHQFFIIYSQTYNKFSNSSTSSRQNPVASPGGIQGETTLCGRLGQALKSDAYEDLGSSALARVLVAVSG